MLKLIQYSHQPLSSVSQGLYRETAYYLVLAQVQSLFHFCNTHSASIVIIDKIQLKIIHKYIKCKGFKVGTYC